MAAIGTLNYLDQDMCVGLHKAHTAARDELSYHITSLRHAGVIDALQKSYLIAQSSTGCNTASGARSKTFTLEWSNLQGLFMTLAAVAVTCSLVRWTVTWFAHRGDSGTLEKFVKAHFPPEQFTVQSIVNHWKSDWEVRFLMRPLVAKTVPPIPHKSASGCSDEPFSAENTCNFLGMLSFPQASHSTCTHRPAESPAHFEGENGPVIRHQATRRA